MRTKMCVEPPICLVGVAAGGSIVTDSEPPGGTDTLSMPLPDEKMRLTLLPSTKSFWPFSVRKSCYTLAVVFSPCSPGLFRDPCPRTVDLLHNECYLVAKRPIEGTLCALIGKASTQTFEWVVYLVRSPAPMNDVSRIRYRNSPLKQYALSLSLCLENKTLGLTTNTDGCPLCETHPQNILNWDPVAPEYLSSDVHRKALQPVTT